MTFLTSILFKLSFSMRKTNRVIWWHRLEAYATKILWLLLAPIILLKAFRKSGESLSRGLHEAAVFTGLIFSYAAPWVCKVSHRLTSVAGRAKTPGCIEEARQTEGRVGSNGPAARRISLRRTG